jgi:formylglycine-generating enzyme required for sulfatase activity
MSLSEQLGQLLRTNPALENDQRRLEAYLRDAQPAVTAKDVRLIIELQKAGSVTQLRREGPNTIPRLTARLAAETHLREEAIICGLQAWAQAIEYSASSATNTPSLLHSNDPCHGISGPAITLPMGQEPGERFVFHVNGIEFAFRWCPAGSFFMGSSLGDWANRWDERPQHEVTITKGYWLGESTVTVEQYACGFEQDLFLEPGKAVISYAFCSLLSLVRETAQVRCLGNFPCDDPSYSAPGVRVWRDNAWAFTYDGSWRRPYYAQTANHPVTCVSWNDATHYSNWISAALGKAVRLPTEAEWEHACRCDSRGPFSFCVNAKDIHCNQLPLPEGDDRSQFRTIGPTVAVLGPRNQWGLYQMNGNVWEWCQDWFSDYSSEPRTNPAGPATETHRVMRGGSWASPIQNCRSAYRGVGNPDERDSETGFRLLIEAD